VVGIGLACTFMAFLWRRARRDRGASPWIITAGGRYGNSLKIRV
jgi:hypothetical protein